MGNPIQVEEIMQELRNNVKKEAIRRKPWILILSAPKSRGRRIWISLRSSWNVTSAI